MAPWWWPRGFGSASGWNNSDSVHRFHETADSFGLSRINDDFSIDEVRLHVPKLFIYIDIRINICIGMVESNIIIILFLISFIMCIIAWIIFILVLKSIENSRHNNFTFPSSIPLTSGVHACCCGDSVIGGIQTYLVSGGMRFTNLRCIRCCYW